MLEEELGANDFQGNPDLKLPSYASAYVFQVPGTQTAAAIVSLGVERNRILTRNVEFFINGLQAAGFDTGVTCTPIVPIMVGTEKRALAMTKFCQDQGVFVLPVLPPAVQEGTARLRANVTAAHTQADIEFALDIFIRAGKHVGII